MNAMNTASLCAALVALVVAAWPAPDSLEVAHLTVGSPRGHHARVHAHGLKSALELRGPGGHTRARLKAEQDASLTFFGDHGTDPLMSLASSNKGGHLRFALPDGGPGFDASLSPEGGRLALGDDTITLRADNAWGAAELNLKSDGGRIIIRTDDRGDVIRLIRGEREVVLRADDTRSTVTARHRDRRAELIVDDTGPRFEATSGAAKLTLGVIGGEPTVAAVAADGTASDYFATYALPAEVTP